MPSVKRDRLLSDLERKRLVDRKSQDKHTRTTNDIRVKKKLAAWLSAMNDVSLIIRKLPEDQVRDVIHDWGIYFLLHIVENMMAINNFYPIEGDAERPDEWQAVTEFDKINKRPIHTRAAEDLDIVRSSMLTWHVNIQGTYLGFHNPVVKVVDLAKLYENPELCDKLTDGEKRAVKRHNKAVEEFLNRTVTFIEK